MAGLKLLLLENEIFTFCWSRSKAPKNKLLISTSNSSSSTTLKMLFWLCFTSFILLLLCSSSAPPNLWTESSHLYFMHMHLIFTLNSRILFRTLGAYSLALNGFHWGASLQLNSQRQLLYSQPNVLTPRIVTLECNDTSENTVKSVCSQFLHMQPTAYLKT